MDILIIIFTVYGISAIITIGKLFEPLRDLAEKHSPNFWKHLTSCMQCLPFWVGILVSLLTETPVKVTCEGCHPLLSTFFTYLFSGAFFSGTTLLIHTIFIRLKRSDWNNFQEQKKQRKTKRVLFNETKF
ncbi:hypothetical protein KFZ70_06825 [Tamlana fucoidanivorans]|uniref:DUF1360 domain-containing protein n=1 Tax=Allotamlana fucoidanivorans TaxID=2583814 RepID=A0A5C4SMG3_9FLAO|nr:hypothetical protein [Tamlana fucoidanivorans]TNJ45276.1 hypothetical protein FGF67_06080 [Tamlana fucoidanivorans]